MVEIIIWLVLMIAFIGVEIVTVGLTSIWFAGGALAALLMALFHLNIFWQIAVFVLVSGVLLVFTRPWALKYFKPRLVKTNYETLIGVDVCLTEAVDNLHGTGTALYKGQEWSARAYVEGKKFEAGEIVTVKEIHGVTLYVDCSENMPSKETEEIQEQ